jgi:DNA-binding PadR family transcriptional regulator
VPPGTRRTGRTLNHTETKGRSAASAVSPEYPLLALLSLEPAHGYELKRRLANDLPGLWNIPESQLYATLKRLEARGLIAARGAEGAGRAGRRRFHLTTAGSRRLEAWLTAPTPPSIRAIRVEFLTRLHFALLRDRVLAGRILTDQAKAVRQALARLQTGLEELPPGAPISRLGAQLRIRQLHSTIDWLAECGATLGLDGETAIR